MTTANRTDDAIIRALRALTGTEQPPNWQSVILEADRRRTTGRKRRLTGGRTTAVLGIALGAATVAAAGVVSVLSLRPHHPALLASAAAAFVARGPVVHVRIESPPRTATSMTLNVATGAILRHQVRRRVQIDLWYDTKTGAFKQTFFDDRGMLQTEWVKGGLSLGTSGAVDPRLSVPPEIRLFSRYKQALRAGNAQFDGYGRVAGHNVIFLLVSASYPVYERGRSNPPTYWQSVDGAVAIDRRSYAPVAFYNGDPAATRPEIIRQAVLVPRRDADLAPPPERSIPATDGFGWPTVRHVEGVSLANAATRLGGHIVNPGTTLAGLRRASITVGLLNRAGAAVRYGIGITYGSTCNGKPRYNGRFVIVEQSAQPEIAHGTTTSKPLPVLTPRATVPLAPDTGFFATCHAPKFGFYSGQDIHQGVWRTAFRKNGLFVSVSSPTRNLTIAATRAIARAR